jgi:hypothetical protein
VPCAGSNAGLEDGARGGVDGGGASTAADCAYRAGIAAGGEPVDWVGWYRERLRRWPDQKTAQPQLANLGDTEHCARFQALPHYWR